MTTITQLIKQRYGAIAADISQETSGRSAAACCNRETTLDPITRDLYSVADSANLPKSALQASLGCGNPNAMINMEVGQTVLDLGSGGGIDCFLSAKRVGPSGKVYGLDMTEDMIRLARRNAEEAGIANVEFLLGTMESIPLADESIDILISNCVINLAANKDIVLAEAHRVLKMGGKLAISDIVLKEELPTSIHENMKMWTGCIAGALTEQEYTMKLRQVGFKNVEIEEVRVYTKSDIEEMSKSDSACCASASAEKIQYADMERMAGNVFSAFVRATK